MKRFSKITVVAVILAMLLQCIAIAVHAEGVSAATNATEARKGVVRIYLMYKDEKNVEYYLKGGTAFFIDSNFIISCYHVCGLTPAEVEDIANDDLYSFDKETFKKNYESKTFCRIFVTRDVNVDAKLTDAKSADLDFAVLKLNTAISNVTVLPLASNDEIEDLVPVTCLGFPEATDTSDPSKVNTSEEVTLTKGSVAKFETIDGTKYFVHDATSASGSSGGPVIVEKNGSVGVVGMSALKNAIETNFSYAICINDVKDVLDKFSIPYKDMEPESVPTPDTTPEPVEPCTHDWSDWKVTKEAQVGVEGVEERTCSICGEKETRSIAAKEDTGESKSGENNNNMLMYIIIGAAVLVVIIIVILILVLTGKKKAPKQVPVQPAPQRPVPPVSPINGNVGQNGAYNQTYQPPQPPVPPVNNGPVGGTTVLNDSGGTTVLGDSGGTTVLAAQPVGYIIRKKTGTKVPVSGTEFVIGKERRRANYCIDDNSNISRAHAKIINRNGSIFISDMNSTNFTFVNGVKVSAGQEMSIKSGDIIKLADEEFEFTV